LVGTVQQGLLDAGFDPKGVDEAYGGNTAAAVTAFQQARDLPVTGTVDDATWQALLKQPIPGTDVRSLELTAAFEGHGYSLAVGNFDGAWLTWGIIGFTLKHGEVQKIILKMHQAKPQLLTDAFGGHAQELLGVVQAPREKQEAWANSVSANGRLVEPWRTGFSWFGKAEEVRAEQRRRAHEDYFLPAVGTANRFGLKSELGLALCFDIHVQNGGVKKAARGQIRDALGSGAPKDEKGLRRIIANAVADHARAKYREDVRSRKLAIAEGRGRVHGANYVLEHWGLSESPAPERTELRQVRLT